MIRGESVFQSGWLFRQTASTTATVIGLMAALAFPAVLMAQGAGPVLSVTSGQAELKDASEQAPWRVASSGTSLAFGQALRADAQFEGRLTYEDGTTLTLKPQTLLQVLPDGLRLHRGAAWIKVIKRGRSFTCVTPSAIASVRGTRFSCEVPSIATVAWRGLVESSLRTAPSIDGLQAPAMATRVGLETFLRLLSQAPGGRMASWTKVFEGKVQVFYPANSGRVVSSWLLEAGQRIHVNQGEASTVVAMADADYSRWSEVPRSELFAPSAPAARAAPGATTPAPSTGAATADTPHSPVVDLLDQPMGY